jgi:glucose/arabinose dehydrogenase
MPIILNRESRIRFSIALAGALMASTAAATLRAESPTPSPQPPTPARLPTEDDYYPMLRMPIPPQAYLEAGGLEWMADGRLAVCTRRGEVWIVDNPTAAGPEKIAFSLFASGLHEPLGLVERDGWLYVTQRGEVTRLADEDGDGHADTFDTVADGWGLSGDYHEYAFGSKFDREGNIWVVLCLTGSFNSNVPYRGWCMRVTPDGQAMPTCSGIRSPGGIGANAEGDMFYTDNQGPWNGTCGLKHLRPGGFMGHPGGNRWYGEPLAAEAMGKRPVEPKSNSRIAVEEQRVDELVPTAVMFPYNAMGQSAAGIACDLSGGKFGPFAGQLFVGDQTHSTVMRVFLQKVDGVYQGVCFPFRQGFGSGSLSLQFAPNGALFVGGTDRGWGARGGKPFSLDRLDWSGKTPFEIHEMRAKSDGFELTFTEPVDAATAGDAKSYELKTYTYIYRSDYGSPEVDQTTPTIQEIRVAEDGRSVRLVVDGLQLGHVHDLRAAGVRSKAGLPLLHDKAYYTLNRIPRE